MNILKMDRAMGKETSYGKKTKQYHANGCNAISDEWIIMYNWETKEYAQAIVCIG